MLSTQSLAVTAAAAIVAIPKQIMVKGQSGGGTMYTVPSGKTFTGHLILGQGNGCQILINGIDLYTTSGTTPYWLEAIPVTLVAGTVVSSGPSYYQWSLIGVEV